MSISSLASPGGSTLATEPVTGDSLTQFVRSIQNLTGMQGQGLLGQGLTQVQGGQQVTSAGVTAMAPSLDFLTKLVHGDQGDITQAAQPEIDTITQQFDQIRDMVSIQPRGGGKATALAEAPFQKAAAIQRTEGQMRQGAANSLAGIASGLANLGLSESGIGISEAGIGNALEALASTNALTRRGQNQQEDASNMSLFASLGQGIGSLIGGLL